MFGFGSVRTPTRTPLFQVKLSAGARWRSTSRGPAAPQCPSSTAGMTTDCEGAATPGVPSSNNMGSTWGHPSQGSACLPRCWQSNRWQHRGVEPSLLHGLVQARAHPRDVQLGQHNGNWASTTTTGPAQPQRNNSSPGAASESPHSKHSYQRLPEVVQSSCSSVSRQHWATCSRCLAPVPSSTHEHSKVTTGLQDLPAEILERRNCFCLQIRTEKLIVSLCWAPMLLLPMKIKVVRKKTCVSWDFSPSGSPLSCFSFGGAAGQWSLAKSVLETCQWDRKQGMETEASEHRSRQKVWVLQSFISLSEYRPCKAEMRNQLCTGSVPTTRQQSLCWGASKHKHPRQNLFFFWASPLWSLLPTSHHTMHVNRRDSWEAPGILFTGASCWTQILVSNPQTYW